ncbi:hypothetical protein TrLO_g365 [Triparma laevis f. longispina]|uniref:Uncharacterized protein n=1 Tax=Triparma laevis f. longispina TaxID=1714387 RepID=A0A9W7F747_9STRA|nr:hypothetical protein TrLO_g365 [Triparma laevis f. longispina]
MSLNHFTQTFSTNPLYSSIHTSTSKYLSRLLKTDLESKIITDEDESFTGFESEEDDPRYMIVNLCDWVCQEIRKIKGKEIEKIQKKLKRTSYTSKSPSRKTPSPEITETSDPTSPSLLYSDFLTPSTSSTLLPFPGNFSEQLWHYTNMHIMSKIWLSRLLCSHPDYPVDEESWGRKVDIMEKNSLCGEYSYVKLPKLVKVSWDVDFETLKISFQGSTNLDQLCVIESLINFLPLSSTPQHIKIIALEIIKRSTRFLNEFENVKDVCTDDLIGFLSTVIRRVNPEHLRSAGWAVGYYDVRGENYYDTYLRSARMIKIGSYKESIKLLKPLPNVNLLSPHGRGGILLNAILTSRPEIVECVCTELNIFLDLRIEYYTGRGRTGLFYAVEKADYEVVSILLRFGADRDMVDNRGDTPLLVAERARLHSRVKCDKGIIVWDDIVDLLRTKISVVNLIEECRKGTAVIRHLIAQGVDVDEGDSGNETCPIIEASKYSRWEVLLLLEKANVDPNKCNTRKETALHHCKSLRIVLKLLEMGANRDSKDENEETPADWASKNGHHEIKAVIENNPDPTPSLCELAKSQNGSAILGLMLQGISSNIQEPLLGFTPLIAAVYNNDIPTATILLQLKEKKQDVLQGDVGEEMRKLVKGNVLADPNFKGRGGMTALHYAAQEGNAKMLALLLRSGGTRNLSDGKSRTPYIIAHSKEGDRYREIETLLSNDPVKVSICAASGRGRWEDVVSLLLQGVDVNSRHNVLGGGEEQDATWKEMTFWGYKKDLDSGDDNVGPSDAIRHELFSPLISACAYNRPRILLSLLKHPQIQTNLPNSKKQTPLMYAAAVGNLDLILPLLKAGADRTFKDVKNRDACNWAETKGHPFASTLISTDPHAISPVAAALTGNPDIMKALILQDVQMDTRVNGQTALIAASKLNHVAVISTILATNPNMEASDDNGESALTASSRLGHVQTVLTLLKSGASRAQQSIAAASKSGQILCGVIIANDPTTSFIHDACYHGKLLLVDALLAQDVDPNMLDSRMTKNASTPLIAACTGLSISCNKTGCKMIIRRLLNDQRTNVDLKNAKGCAALMVAASFDVEVVKLLVKNGADTSLKDCNGHNASWYSYNGVGNQAWGKDVGGGGAGQRIKYWAAI